MPSKKTTTVVLGDKAQQIKNRLAPVFGLKTILSVGLELFDKLPDNKKIELAAAVNQKPVKPIETKAKQSKPESLKAAINAIKKQAKWTPEGEIIFRLHSKEEQAELAELRRLLGPEPKHKKKQSNRPPNVDEGVA